MAVPDLDNADRTELAGLVRQLSVVFGRVTLSSGKEADYYVDLRRATLHHRAAPLIGRLMRELTADWDYAAVGGLTMGADPVAPAPSCTHRGVPLTRLWSGRRRKPMGCKDLSKAPR